MQYQFTCSITIEKFFCYEFYIKRKKKEKIISNNER